MFIPNILIAGAEDKAALLRELSARLYVTDSGKAAIQCLRSRKIDTVISRWELVDIGGGKFLKSVIEAKPGIPTLAIIKTGDYVQEVAARSSGVSAVLTDDIDDEHFRDTVCQLVNILEASPPDRTEYEIEGMKYTVVNT
jgi:DNA-binding NtrC family response regulator